MFYNDVIEDALNMVDNGEDADNVAVALFEMVRDDALGFAPEVQEEESAPPVAKKKSKLKTALKYAALASVPTVAGIKIIKGINKAKQADADAKFDAKLGREADDVAAKAKEIEDSKNKTDDSNSGRSGDSTMGRPLQAPRAQTNKQTNKLERY